MKDMFQVFVKVIIDRVLIRLNSYPNTLINQSWLHIEGNGKMVWTYNLSLKEQISWLLRRWC